MSMRFEKEIDWLEPLSGMQRRVVRFGHWECHVAYGKFSSSCTSVWKYERRILFDTYAPHRPRPLRVSPHVYMFWISSEEDRAEFYAKLTKKLHMSSKDHHSRKKVMESHSPIGETLKKIWSRVWYESLTPDEVINGDIHTSDTTENEPFNPYYMTSSITPTSQVELYNLANTDREEYVELGLRPFNSIDHPEVCCTDKEKVGFEGEAVRDHLNVLLNDCIDYDDFVDAVNLEPDDEFYDASDVHFSCRSQVNPYPEFDDVASKIATTPVREEGREQSELDSDFEKIVALREYGWEQAPQENIPEEAHDGNFLRRFKRACRRYWFGETIVTEGETRESDWFDVLSAINKALTAALGSTYEKLTSAFMYFVTHSKQWIQSWIDHFRKSYKFKGIGSIKTYVTLAVATLCVLFALSMPQTRSGVAMSWGFAALSVLAVMSNSFVVTGAVAAITYTANAFRGQTINLNIHTTTTPSHIGVEQGAFEIKQDVKEFGSSLIGCLAIFYAGSVGIDYTDLSSQGVENIMKRHALLGRSLLTWEKLAEKFGEVLEKAIGIVFKYALKKDYISSSSLSDIEALYEKVMSWCTLQGQMKIGRDPQVAMEIEKAFLDYCRFKKMYHDNRELMARLLTLGIPLTDMYKRIVSKNPMAHVMRMEPVCMMFRGRTGVGKSYLMNVLKTDLLKIDGTCDPGREGMLYSRCSEQEFWDGYTGQVIVVFDDFGQAVDSALHPNLDFFDLIRSSNTFPYMLHSAALEEKANNPFTSPFIVCTTNLENYKGQVKSLISVEALERRIHLDIEVSLIPEVTVAANRHRVGAKMKWRLDPLMLKEYRERNKLDVHDNSHYRFHVDGQTVSYDELVVMISKEYERHYLEYEVQKKTSEVVAERSLPKGAFSRSAKWANLGVEQAAGDLDPIIEEEDEGSPNDFSHLDDNIRRQFRKTRMTRQECEEVRDDFGMFVPFDVFQRLPPVTRKLLLLRGVQVFYSMQSFWTKIDYLTPEVEDFEQWKAFCRTFEHNFCEEHTQEVPDPDCPFCERRACKFDYMPPLAITLDRKILMFNAQGRPLPTMDEFLEKSKTNLRENEPIPETMWERFWNDPKDWFGILTSEWISFRTKWEMGWNNSISTVINAVTASAIAILVVRAGYEFYHGKKLEATLRCCGLIAASCMTEIYVALGHYTIAEIYLMLGTVLFACKHFEEVGHVNDPSCQSCCEYDNKLKDFNPPDVSDKISIGESLEFMRSTPPEKIMKCVAEGFPAGDGNSAFVGRKINKTYAYEGVSAHFAPRTRAVRAHHEGVRGSDLKKDLDGVLAEEEGPLSQNASNLIPKVRRNLAKLFFCAKDSEDNLKCEPILIGQIFFINGNVAFINRHYLVNVRNLCERYSSAFPMLGVSTCDTTIPIWSYAREIVMTSKPFIRKNSDPEKTITELYTMRLPRKVPARGNLIYHFVPKEKLKHLTTGMTMSLISHNISSNGRTEPVTREGKFASMITVDLQTTRGVKPYALCGKTNISTQQGDCGGVYLMNTDEVNNRLCGIHFAGLSGGGAFCVITQEDLSEFRNEETLGVENGIEQYDVNFPIPDSPFVVMGKIDAPVYQPTKTKIQPSLIAGEVLPVLSYPAKLQHPLTPEGPMIKGIRKYATEPFPLDPVLCDEAVVSYEALLAKLPPPEGFETQVLSYEMACEGIPGNENFPPIKRTKSAGWPLMKEATIGKQKWLGKEEWDFSSDDARSLRTKVEIMERDCRHGKIPEIYFVDTLKDEKRPWEKVAAGKTRVFSAAPLVYSILLRQYFMGFLAYMTRTRIGSECCVGTKIYEGDWDYMALHLEFKPHEKTMIAGDFSNFDGTVHFDLFDRIVDIANWHYNDSVQNQEIRKILWRATGQARHILHDMVYQIPFGQPSGNPTTAVSNSIYNSLAVRYCYAKIFGTAVNFNTDIHMIAYGDDNIISVHPRCQERFNPLSLSAGFKSIGMTYTSEDKGEQSANFRSLSEVSFLKRGFVLSEGKWLFPLAIDSIGNMLNWITKGRNPDLATRQNIKGAIEELYYHDEKTFTDIVDKIKSCAAKHDIRIPTLAYSTARSYIAAGNHSQVITSLLD